MHKKLSIIIVNYHTYELLEKCLTSLYQYLSLDEAMVYVVDNASILEKLEPIRKRFPAIFVISNKTNKGFAGANNQAIKQADSDFICLLNSDAFLFDVSFNYLVTYLTEGHEGVGIVAPKLINTDMTLQPSCRRFPNVWAYLLISLKLFHLFPRMKVYKDYLMTDWAHDEPQSVDQPMGACLLIRKKVFDQIGLLDEQYFIWFEEIDFCKRAKMAGWDIVFLPIARVVHLGGQSFAKQSNLWNQINMNKSLLRYFSKYHSKLEWGLLWFACIINLGLAIAYYPLASLKKISKHD